MDNYNSPSAPDLAYDLRQRYAKIVGDHLEDIAFYRKERKYSEYFRALEDLYTITQHKFKDKNKEIKIILKKDGEKDKTEKQIINYSLLKSKVIEISNNYPNAWGGEGTESEEIAKIEKSLRDLEMFLYSKMDDANMFGSKRETEGLI